MGCCRFLWRWGVATSGVTEHKTSTHFVFFLIAYFILFEMKKENNHCLILFKKEKKKKAYDAKDFREGR